MHITVSHSISCCHDISAQNKTDGGQKKKLGNQVKTFEKQLMFSQPFAFLLPNICVSNVSLPRSIYWLLVR